MSTQGIYTITENKPIARDVYRLRLLGDTSALCRPGQFVNVALSGRYLRRPISVCAYREGEMVLIYKVLGQGTAQMATMKTNDTLDLLVGLGNGFDTAPAKGKKIALIGGGVGLPPLYGVMEALQGEDVRCVMGFQSAVDVFYEQKFAALGASVTVATADGSLGVHGFVTDALSEMDYGYYFACGPQPMLKAVHALGLKKGAAGQLSFEERMGCGFGACMGCSCQTLVGNRRICVDGPVFRSEEVAF